MKNIFQPFLELLTPENGVRMRWLFAVITPYL